MKTMFKVLWILIFICLSMQAQAKADKVLTDKLGALVISDIYAAVTEDSFPAQLIICPEGLSKDIYAEKRSEIFNDVLVSYRIFDADKQKIMLVMEDFLKKVCGKPESKNLTLVSLIQATVNDAKGAALELTESEKKVKALEDKANNANANRKKKILRPAAEIVQLYDMACYKPYIKNFVFGLPPWDRITDRCRSKTPDSTDEMLKVMELKQFPDTTDTQRQKDEVTRIHDLRLKLNHEDWDRDHYWFGLNETWLSNANTTATSLTVHAYPWYARSVGIFTVEDITRRFSVYLGAGQVSQSTVGTNSYSGGSISAGVGLELTRGFMLTWGSVYYPKTTGGVSSYTSENIWGITLSSEIASQLMGGE